MAVPRAASRAAVCSNAGVLQRCSPDRCRLISAKMAESDRSPMTLQFRAMGPVAVRIPCAVLEHQPATSTPTMSAMNDLKDVTPAAAGAAPALSKSTFDLAVQTHIEMFSRMAVLGPQVQALAERLSNCMGAGGTLLVCGHGANGLLASRMAVRLTGACRQGGPALPAIAICPDAVSFCQWSPSLDLSALPSSQVRAYGRAGDALLVLGHPPEDAGAAMPLQAALAVARERGLTTAGLLIDGDDRLSPLCHEALRLPPADAARMVEARQFMVEVLCDEIERRRGVT